MTIGTQNRVLAYADKVRATIESGIKPDGSPTAGPEELDRLDRTLNLTTMEWMAYQNAQARAHVVGTLATDEAQTVYMALNGEVPTASGWADGVDLALKVTVTNLIGELIGAGR